MLKNIPKLEKLLPLGKSDEDSVKIGHFIQALKVFKEIRSKAFGSGSADYKEVNKAKDLLLFRKFGH